MSMREGTKLILRGCVDSFSAGGILPIGLTMTALALASDMSKINKILATTMLGAVTVWSSYRLTEEGCMNIFKGIDSNRIEKLCSEAIEKTCNEDSDVEVEE